MHLALKMCNFYLWNVMAVVHSDCFECHHNGKGFIVATTRVSMSVLFFLPHHQCFTSESLPTKGAANCAELSVEFPNLSFVEIALWKNAGLK